MPQTPDARGAHMGGKGRDSETGEKGFASCGAEGLPVRQREGGRWSMHPTALSLQAVAHQRVGREGEKRKTHFTQW